MLRDLTQLAILNSHAPFDAAVNKYADGALGNLLHKSLNVVKGTYDFTVQAGAIGSLNLNDDTGVPLILPNGATVLYAVVVHSVACTSGGSATVSLGLKTAVDVLAATAVASMTGVVPGAPTFAANAITSFGADKPLTMAIATATLTAGKFSVYLVYVV